jgi:hypothetical protein
LKNISTLVQDIRDRLTSGKPFDAETVEIFAKSLAAKLANRLSAERGKPSLRLSNLGTKCDRKLWYSIKCPELSEPLPASARFKFLFGDVIEELLLFLARASGHTVENEQKEVKLVGVTGHIDGVVDGELVDCKSASTFGFKKFKEHGLGQDDPFGYLTQLDGYLSAMPDGDLSNTSRGHFLVADKTLGHITLDTYEKANVDYDKLVANKRAMLAFPQPPTRAYDDVKDGESGNRKLGMACSYCAFKSTCWPGLRTYAYSRGPAYLTVVAREPNVPEIKNAQAE